MLPPQWRAVGGRSSSAAATATSRSRDTGGSGWVGAAGAGTKEAWAGAEGEIGGRPR